jgi:preprotein translocase subunit YajC
VSPIDIVPIVGVFAVMYFLMIRPQIRERQEHEKLVSSLARGDKVVTASGVHGTISNVAADTVLLEVSEKTRIVIDKTSVARRFENAEPVVKTEPAK